MKGWKTWTGIIGAFLTFVASKYFGVDIDAAGADASKFMDLIQAAFVALGVVGFGHKIEKIGK